MNKITVVTHNSQDWKEIKKQCKEMDFLFYPISPQEAEQELEKGKTQLVILDLEQADPLLQWMKDHELTKEIPILWVLPRQKIQLFKPDRRVADWILSPVEPIELFCRIRQLFYQSQKIESHQKIQTDNLFVDFEKYEVKLDGELIALTYKEYELLKFLISNPGKVFTREVLLNKVWGYDYFGGTRTVDVHIRRLRSKIENAKHTYVETVRNIGYRFKE